MLLFLKIKHWQLFIITWAFTCIAILIGFFDIGLALTLIPIVLITGSIGFFGWIYSIGTTIHPLLPSDIKMNIRLFKYALIIPIIFMFLLISWISLTYFNQLPDMSDISATRIATIVVPLHLLSLVIISWAIIFVSKIIKAVEIQRSVRFHEITLEFFQIWFSIIGIWSLQPKLNRIVTELETSNK